MIVIDAFSCYKRKKMRDETHCLFHTSIRTRLEASYRVFDFQSWKNIVIPTVGEGTMS